jgi:hypothetical protein
MTFKAKLINYARIGVLFGVSGIFLLPYIALIIHRPVNPTTSSGQTNPTGADKSAWVWTSDSPDPGSVATYKSWDQKPVTYTPDNLGINYPWLEKPSGAESVNWLGADYSASLVDKDLEAIQKMGVTKIRAFCQLESIFDYQGQSFVIKERNAANLDDFLNRAGDHGISVVCVMQNGNYSLPNRNLDGNLRWDLIRTPEGMAAYKSAFITYINRFRTHNNILMWDMVNEPYGSLVWSNAAKELKITPQEVHQYLLLQYQTIKPLAGSVPVGFSDLEDSQLPQFNLYSNDTLRKTLVDDCTDIYAMHIYRGTADQVPDFRNLTGKPKWGLELGSYNYDDPNAKQHDLPAANELYDAKENYLATRSISTKLLNSGFALVMPWAFNANPGMVEHNPDGSYKFVGFAAFMKYQLMAYQKQSSQSPSSGTH